MEGAELSEELTERELRILEGQLSDLAEIFGANAEERRLLQKLNRLILVKMEERPRA